MSTFDLGAYLREARERQNLSTHDLAGRTSVSAGQISRIENHKTSPGFHTLQKIVGALDLSLVIVLNGSNQLPETVTVLSTEDIAQSLLQALHRTELMELLMYCREMTDEQLNAILTVAQAIRGFTKPIGA